MCISKSHLTATFYFIFCYCIFTLSMILLAFCLLSDLDVAQYLLPKISAKVGLVKLSAEGNPSQRASVCHSRYRILFSFFKKQIGAERFGRGSFYLTINSVFVFCSSRWDLNILNRTGLQTRCVGILHLLRKAYPHVNYTEWGILLPVIFVTCV